MHLSIRLLVVLGLFLPVETLAQRSSDSVAVRRLAELAQIRFERIRRLNLPARHTGTRRECDARIGRFCHWNSSDDTIVAPEPANVRRAKVALLSTLDSLSRRSRSDGWITGQRIRYLLEMRDDSTAVKVASECRAADWWCNALRGLTLHEAGAGHEADSAYAFALAQMPEKERCTWTDMTPLLDAAQRKRYGKLGCGRDEKTAAQLWWIADPFLSVPGNERQAEHFARHTMAKILEPARIVYNLSWANDLREMIVRYGWARYWTRGRGSMQEPEGGPVSGHEATPNYHFIPASLALDSLHAVDFDLDEEQSPERYAPVTASRVSRIVPQVALFRRGDSAQVVVAFDASTRKPLDSAAVRSALILGSSENDKSVTSDSVRRGALTAMIDDRPHLLGLEVLSPDKRRAAWYRAGVWLPEKDEGDVEVSDILLFEPGNNEVADLQSALPLALPGHEVKRGKTGIYWEIYGLAAADSALPVSLTLTPFGQSALRRIGESIGLAPRTSPLNIAWRESPRAGGISARSVVLDLSLIPRGKYVLSVEVRPSGKSPAVSSRQIEIR